MANLQGSGAISIGNVKNLFGGPASPSLSNYYRGGSYIPSQKTVAVTVYEPPDGNTFLGTTPVLVDGYYYVSSVYKGVWFTFNAKTIWWNDVIIASNVPDTLSSYTVGSYTYYKGAYLAYSNFSTSCYCSQDGFAVRRTSGGSTTVGINAGIPSSGQIKLSHFYGAEKP